MGGRRRTAEVEELLAESSWLRELALRLAGDPDRADDAVQDTWIAALRRPPEPRGSARPWLAGVLRNALRMRARSESRRQAREQAAPVGDEVATPEALVARAEAQPVSGATVTLASLASESGAVAPPQRQTGPDGRFDFGIQPAIEWSVRATAPGKAGVALPVDLRSPFLDPRPDQLALELGPCDAALVGTIGDASGGAIAGARIARIPDRGARRIPGGAQVTTGEDGAFELCLELHWPGRVLVEISADGYGAIRWSGQVLGRVRLDFALVPEAIIAGRVVRDDTGEPVPEAYVFVPRGPGGVESTAWRGTFADPEGRFRIAQVAPGRHRVYARADGLVMARRAAPVVVEPGQTAAEIEIRMGAAATVRGVVLEGGEPVAGARLAAIGRDGTGGSRTAVSQRDGSFVLEEVPRGEVRLTARPYDVVSPTSLQIDGGERAGVVVEVESLGSIAGQVVRGQRPVPGARIQLHGPNEHQIEPVTADADGRFEARGLRAGPWLVFAEDTARGRFGRAPGTVEVARGETAEVTVDVVYGAAIAGRVIDQHGEPVSGVSVQFWHTGRDDAGMAVTSEDGTFRAATMTGGGQYRTVVRPIQGSKIALRPANGDGFPLITLADGDSEVTGVVIAVKLDRLSIAGRVVDSGGAAVADARVSASVRGGARPGFFRWVHHAAATTDVTGGFAIGELSDGTYALRVRSPSGAEATVPSIAAGTDDVVVTLPTPGAIAGRLVGFSSPPRVDAWRVDARGSTAPARGSVESPSFAVDNLSPGTYVVSARTATEAASARVSVAAGSTARVTLSSRGSGAVTGRVHEFRTGAPVEGMSCRARPRHGDDLAGGAAGEPSRTDARGVFLIDPAPAGPLAVICRGLYRSYSDGLRRVELPASGRLEIEVPVVAWNQEVSVELGGMGAEIETFGTLVPRLIAVQPGGPAGGAGLRDGDRVVAVDGDPVDTLSPRGVRTLIINRSPGSEVSLTVSRDGETLTRTLTLIEYQVP